MLAHFSTNYVERKVNNKNISFPFFVVKIYTHLKESKGKIATTTTREANQTQNAQTHYAQSHEKTPSENIDTRSTHKKLTPTYCVHKLFIFNMHVRKILLHKPFLCRYSIWIHTYWRYECDASVWVCEYDVRSANAECKHSLRTIERYLLNEQSKHRLYVFLRRHKLHANTTHHTHGKQRFLQLQ